MAATSQHQQALTTFCIAISALTAGSIFCFPLFGPTLTRDLGLNLTQTNTIFGGAVLGEYLTAAIWGVIADATGPRVLSIAAAVLSVVGYQLMAHADVVAYNASLPYRGSDDKPMATASFIITVISFVGIGSSVAASYFAAVTASTRLYTTRPGMAISAPLTLFSMSSLFLTWLGTAFFSDKETGDLNAPAFLSFLGWLLGATNAFSAVFMIAPPPQDKPLVAAQISADGHQDGDSTQADESTALLGDHRSHEADQHIAAIPGVASSDSLVAFIMSPPVWTLAFLMVVGVGASEMVLGSVGNMVVALMGTAAKKMPLSDPSLLMSAMLSPGNPAVGPVALQIRATQVKLLAGANTLSRLSGGILSDLLAPPPPGVAATRTEAAETWSSRLPRISRVSLLIIAVCLLTGAYAWAAFGLTTVAGLPPFSVLVGCGYGFIFTLVPAITVSAFGTKHFGRNWGLLSYCCALGSSVYTLLYAFVSDAVADKRGKQVGGGGGLCVHGRECFQASFIVSLIGTLAALAALLPLWKRWRAFL